MIDLVSMQELRFKDEGFGEEYESAELSDQLRASAQDWRRQMLEHLSLYDDDLLEKIVEEQQVEQEEIVKVLRNATLSVKITPVLCGSAF